MQPVNSPEIDPITTSLPSPYAFFQSNEAGRLANTQYHPAEITTFLQEEERLLNALSPSVDLLIEIGCVEGSYLPWAIQHDKHYIGIDIVPKYIDAGQRLIAEQGLSNEQYRFVLGDAEDIADIVQATGLTIPRERCLVMFPFNIFGAIPHIDRVLSGIQASRLPLLISTYQTTNYVTACRWEYYERCGYPDLQLMDDEQGVRFFTSDGFCTEAYRSAYLQDMLHRHMLSALEIEWSSLNRAYITTLLFKQLQQTSFMRDTDARRII